MKSVLKLMESESDTDRVDSSSDELLLFVTLTVNLQKI